MKTEYKPYVDALIELAIREDIGDGDHTSLCCIPADERGRMRLLCKQEGIIAGIEIARLVLERLDPTVEFDQRIADGTLHTKVLDTRKTTPGMRVLDKMAVKLGGGENHRMGLFDMILLKDNHIDFAGGIVPAIRGAKQYLRERDKNIPIECEVRTLEDIDLVFEAGGVDRIMFDNFSPEMTRKAVEKVAGRCETESSGGITLDTLRTYAETGVDFISVGALTHQIRSLDMSLKACE